MFDFSRFDKTETWNQHFFRNKIASSSEDLQKQHFFFKKSQKLCFLCFLLKIMLSWPRKSRILNFQKTRFTLTRTIEIQIKLKKTHFSRWIHTQNHQNSIFSEKVLPCDFAAKKKSKTYFFHNIFSKTTKFARGSINHKFQQKKIIHCFWSNIPLALVSRKWLFMFFSCKYLQKLH